MLAWVTIGGGAAALAAGAVFGVLSRQALERRDALATDPTTWAEYQQEDDAARSRSLLANVLIGVGGTAAAVGVVLLLLGDGDAADTGALGLVPAPGGLLLMAGGTL